MRRKDLWSLAAIAALAGLLFVRPARAEFEQNFKISADELRIANLVGAIQVHEATGKDFEVDVTVRGDDADEKLINFELKEGRDASLVIGFPVEDESDYVYPELGRNSSTTIRLNHRRGDGNGGWWRDLFSAMGGRRIEVSGSGRGLEMWADLDIGVPKGKALVVMHGVGAMDARDVEGDLILDSHAGPISAERITGDLSCDTGSGHVEVSDVTGVLEIDTGSGHVDAANVTGKSISIDTGSGHVTLSDAKADDINIDTGSGSVQVDKADCEELEIDTGSGSVETRDLGADRAKIDTGSGAVLVDLVRMGGGPYRVDTGSGRITLRLPGDANASVMADAGSGGVDVDVDDARMRHKDRDSAEFEIGDGDAQIELDTGSGRIVISQR
jgi:hypothetical protein